MTTDHYRSNSTHNPCTGQTGPKCLVWNCMTIIRILRKTRTWRMIPPPAPWWLNSANSYMLVGGQLDPNFEIPHPSVETQVIVSPPNATLDDSGKVGSDLQPRPSTAEKAKDLGATAAISDKYDYHPKEKTWEEARKACEELPGASLIQIKSQEQQDTARKLVENSTLELIHIGIFHHHGFLPPSAEWKYMDKTIITYSSWADGEPNPMMLTHAALKKDAGYKWAVVGDEERGGWICDRHPKE
ncbi:macrophage mannose receptor 1-like [Haliotis rufescens]|uniref:macrophage mannose receptor 1-like n=1 Tax=Haliotis rufescens TaxID=6454 RepID=UPI00201F4604|nr:macrophage mannose receptor 1-like [Haliotis rufescens]